MNKEQKDDLLRYLRNKNFRQIRLPSGTSIYVKCNLVVHEALVGAWSVTDSNSGSNFPIETTKDFLDRYPYVRHQVKEEEIVRVRKDTDQARFFMNDVDWSKVKPYDEIDIHREEAFYTENNSSDGSSILVISRDRFYTDEEQADWKQHFKNLEEKNKKERYEQYLKLKEEFEPAENKNPGT